MGHSAYPLEWPQGMPRRTAPRCSSQFRKLNYRDCARDLQAEIDKLGGYDATLSTAIPLRMDGTPKLREYIGDPGVAVYFKRKIYQGRKQVEKEYAVACEQYYTTAENLRALVVTLAAMRTIERHGSSDLFEQAMSGFAALPPAQERDPWWKVLGFDKRPSLDAAKVRYRQLVAANHPDRGGDGTKVEAFSSAIREAEREDAA